MWAQTHTEDIKEPKNINNKIKIIYMFSLFFLYILIIQVPGKFTKIDHNVGNKEKLNRFQKAQRVEQSSDCSTKKLEFNNHQKLKGHYSLKIFLHLP